MLHDTKSIELVTKRPFSKDELCSVRSVKTVDAIGPTNPVLKGYRVPPLYILISWHSQTYSWTIKQGSSLVFRMKLVGEGFGPRVKEASLLNRFLSDILKVADDILSLPIKKRVNYA